VHYGLARKHKILVEKERQQQKAKYARIKQCKAWKNLSVNLQLILIFSNKNWLELFHKNVWERCLMSSPILLQTLRRTLEPYVANSKILSGFIVTYMSWCVKWSGQCVEQAIRWAIRGFNIFFSLLSLLFNRKDKEKGFLINMVHNLQAHTEHNKMSLLEIKPFWHKNWTGLKTFAPKMNLNHT